MDAVAHDPDRHLFSRTVDGHRASLDYEIRADVMTITHTRVPDAIGGRGIAAQLTEAALRFAKSKNWSISAQCSYARTYLARHATNTSDGSRAGLEDIKAETRSPPLPPSTSGGG